ncbi:MAG: hypothetical protein R3A48_16685 [Polyangiales bacterium]
MCSHRSAHTSRAVPAPPALRATAQGSEVPRRRCTLRTPCEGTPTASSSCASESLPTSSLYEPAPKEITTSGLPRAPRTTVRSTGSSRFTARAIS